MISMWNSLRKAGTVVCIVHVIYQLVWVLHPRGPPFPGSTIPKVLPLGLYFRGILWGLNPLYKISTQKTFYNVFLGSILTPLITKLTLLIMSKRTTDRDFSPESHTEEVTPVRKKCYKSRSASRQAEENSRLNASKCKEVTFQSPRAKARKSQQLAPLCLNVDRVHQINCSCSHNQWPSVVERSQLHVWLHHVLGFCTSYE